MGRFSTRLEWVGFQHDGGSRVDGFENHNKLARVSYTVELAYDGKSSVLAGGLTEDQANALAAEVGQRSGWFAW